MGLQAHDVGDRDDAGQSILLVNHANAVNTIFGNAVERLENKVIFADRNQRCVHYFTDRHSRRINPLGNHLIT